MNSVNLIGRLTATPELKATPNGKSVCNFTLAVERKFKDTDGKPIVDFIDCVVWENNAIFLCKWFDKGVRVAISGETQTRMYEDKDGKKIKVSEVFVNTVEFADGKREANEVATNTTPTTNQANDDIFNNDIFKNDGFVPVDSSDDLPFK